MAASRCSLSRHSQCFSPPCGRRAKPCSPYLCNIISLRHASLSSSSCFPLTCSCSLKTLNFASRARSRRLGSAVPALVSEESATESASSSTESFKLTYLEVNSWLWEIGGVKLLVDPILVGTLDFGIPWLYDAAKKPLKNFQVTYVEAGQNTEIEGKNGSRVRIRATAGPVLGPPWQRPENGYIVSSSEGRLTLYYEPHCVYNEELLKDERADIVITPVIKQLLPNLTLVSGQEDAVKLAKLLRARFVVPMKNGDLDSKGLLATIIKAEGTVESFKELLSKELPDAKVLEPTPGVTLEIAAP